MTPELPKTLGQSAENPLGPFEARFRQLETEIKTSLRLPKSLIIVMTNSEDREDGVNLGINSAGTWLLSTELDYPLFTNGSKDFLGVVKKYAYEKRIDADTYLRASIEARRSLNISVEENPGPLAEGLLEHMEQALQRHKEKPH